MPNVLREALFMVDCRDCHILSIKPTQSVSTNRHLIACRNSSVNRLIHQVVHDRVTLNLINYVI